MKKFLVFITVSILYSCSQSNQDNEKQILNSLFNSGMESKEDNSLHTRTKSDIPLGVNADVGYSTSKSEITIRRDTKRSSFTSLSSLFRLILGASLIPGLSSQTLIWTSGGNTLYDITGEYQLNSFENFDQTDPAVTYLTDRDFVPMWQNSSKGRGIYGQIFTRQGSTVGSRFLVNTNTTGFKGSPDVDCLSSGGFVTVWESFGQESGSNTRYGVYTQFFNQNGLKVGNETHVNNYTIDDQTHPRVKKLSDDYVVYAWQSDDQEPVDNFGDSGGEGIYIRAMETVNRTFINLDYLVNTQTTGDQEKPGIAALMNNQFVVTYSTENEVDKDVAFQRVLLDTTTNTFSKQGSETKVNTVTAGFQGNPDIDTLTTGEFVITWQSTFNNLVPTTFVIKGRKYNSTGGPVTAETLVSLSTTSTSRTCPVVAKLPNGRFIIAWAEQNVTGAEPYTVMAQVFENNFTTIGPIFQVNTFTTGTDSFCPAIASEKNGFEFVIVWESINPVPFKNNLNVFGNNYLFNDGSPTRSPTPAPTDAPTTPTEAPTATPTNNPAGGGDDDEFTDLELGLIIGGSILAFITIITFGLCIYFYLRNR